VAQNRRQVYLPTKQCKKCNGLSMQSEHFVVYENGVCKIISQVSSGGVLEEIMYQLIRLREQTI